MTTTAADLNRPPGVLRTFWLPILLVTALVVGSAAALVAARAPVYVATGAVLVNADRQGGAPLLPQMGTERAIATSAEIAERAADSLALPPATAARNLTVTVPVDATVLQLTYAAATPEGAQAGARAFIEAYVDYRNRERRRPLVQVIAEPTPPLAPDPPDYAVPLLIALVAGLGLGFVACVAWDQLRGRLRGPGDAARVTGCEVLAELPAGFPVGTPFAVPASSGFGHLAARLCSLVGDRRTRVVVMVTSPRRGAGTTTVATHLANGLAAVGREVVLVSSNLRRPDLHRVLGLRREPGLAELLRGATGLAETIQFTPRPNLRVLTAGDSGATTHLDIDDFRLVLWQLSRDAIVVVDAAPVLESAETVLMGELTDLALLVVDSRSGRRADAAEAVQVLGRTRSTLAGLVANRPRRRRRSAAAAPQGGSGVAGPPGPAPASAGSAPAPVTRTAADAERSAGDAGVVERAI